MNNDGKNDDGKSSINRSKADAAIKEGKALEGLRRFDQAIAQYRQALTLDPLRDEAYKVLFDVTFYELKDYEAAQALLEDAGKAGLDSLAIKRLWGQLLLSLGKLREAEAKLRLCVAEDPSYYWSQYYLGTALEQLEEYSQAVPYLEAAVKLDPNFDMGWFHLGRVMEPQGKHEEALRAYKEADRCSNAEGHPGAFSSDIQRASSQAARRDQWTELPRVPEMLAYLDRFVWSQNQAKKDLVTAVYQHYLSLSYQDASLGNEDLGRFNVLIFGPSGCGKTYTIERLTKKLGVPLVIVSASSLSETGYVGKNVDTILEDLLVAASYDVRRAERGIVFIDEIDKIRRNPNPSGNDVSGEGVQNSLLTLIEGKPYQIEMRNKGTYTVDTSRVLFICAGAFVEIKSIVEKRLFKRSLGFASKPEIEKGEAFDIFKAVNIADLEEYGLIPQLCGRFATISHLSVLTKEDLKMILTSMENSVVAKYRKFFELHGILLELTTDAIDAIVEQADASRTGARGLRSGIANALKMPISSVNQLEADGVSRIIVSAESVQKGTAPQYLTESRKFEPVSGQLRREALGARAAGAEKTVP